MNLGNYLHDYRSKNGLSQRALGEQLGVTQTTIMYLETGQRGPSVKLARKISDMLCIPLDKLLR